MAEANGKAFPANDRVGLEQVFARINELEPTPHTVRKRVDYADQFAWLLALGSALIGLALALEPRLRGVV